MDWVENSMINDVELIENKNLLENVLYLISIYIILLSYI